MFSHHKIATIRDRILLVLDDYHLIDGASRGSAAIHDALTFLLRHLPPPATGGLHLIINIYGNLGVHNWTEAVARGKALGGLDHLDDTRTQKNKRGSGAVDSPAARFWFPLL